MKIIQGITDDPNQKMTLAIDGGTLATLSIYYREQQQSWFFDLSWNGTFFCYGRRLVVHPNVLRQQRALIPFGIGVSAPSNFEPLAQASFANGSATLFLLNSDDVDTTEDAIYPGP